MLLIALAAPARAQAPDAQASDLALPDATPDEAQPEQPKPPPRPVFDWRPINHQNFLIIQAGNYETALPYVENGLKSCPDAIDAREAALCEAIFSENRAEIREHMGDLAGAEADLKVYIDRRAAVLPPLDPLNAGARYSRSVFYFRHGRRAEEIEDLLVVEKIYRTLGPDKRSSVVAIETRRAQALQALGRNAEAVPLLQDAYGMERESKGPTDTSTLVTANNLFTSLRLQGFTGAAFTLADDVLRSDQADQYDAVQRAVLAAAFAMDADSRPRQAAALGYAEAALSALEATKTAYPDAMFGLLRGLARLHLQTGHADASVTMALRALAIASQTWGPNSVAVSKALRDEANAEAERGDYDIASTHLTDAAASLAAPGFAIDRAQIEVERGKILSKAGRDHDAVTSHQAMAATVRDSDLSRAVKTVILSLIGQDIERISAIYALPTCEQATQLAEGAVGLSLDYVIGAETCTGLGLIAMDRPAEALQMAERARQALWGAVARQSGVEPSLWWQNRVLLVQSRALLALKRNDEALVVLQEKLALDKRYDPVVEADTWGVLSSVQRSMGRYADADDSVSDGLAALGETGYDVSRALLLQQRALAYMASNQAAAAVGVYETILTLHKSGSDQFLIGATERDLAAAFTQAGRPSDAGAHLDAAIDIFRAFGPSRQNDLRGVLETRITNATQQNDQERLETATREILPLYAPDSGDALAARSILANVLDGKAQRADADGLRAEAVRINTQRFGANSTETVRTRLNGLYWLRISGRMVEAQAFSRDCFTLAETVESMKLACLIAAAETDMQEGAFRDAAGAGDQAIAEIEDHWDRYSSFLQETIMQRARAAAAMGDVAGVIRLYDRVHDLARHDGSGRGWIDATFVRLLLEAGEPGNAETIQTRVLADAKKANDTALIVAIMMQKAEHQVDIGNAGHVDALWEPVVPDLGNKPSANRVHVLESLGRAAAAQGRDEAAAELFQDAAQTAGTVFGIGSQVYRTPLVERAMALARLGRINEAERAVQPLTQDPCPAAALAHTEAEMQIALEADDMVAAVQNARIALALTETAYGAQTPVTATARLDLAQIEMLAGQAIDRAMVADATAVLLQQQPGWQSQIRIARLQGMMTLREHDLAAAEASFVAVERMILEHKGPDSLDVARARASRATVRLEAGDAQGADVLFRQALDLAAPKGDWRNALWAHIAMEAATAAERAGDPDRSSKLRRDAASVVPTVTAHTTNRWL